MVRFALLVALAVPVRFCLADSPATMSATSVSETKVDPDLPNYRRVASLAGTIRSVGSPTTGALISAWAEEFKKIYPDVNFDLKGGKSGAVLPAFLSKTPPNLGAMSRPMTDDEAAAFK